MGKLQNRIKEAGQMWGLPPNRNDKTVYGDKAGLGVQLLAGKKGNVDAFVGVVRWDSEDKDDTVRKFFSSSSRLRDAGIKPDEIKIQNGMATYTKPVTLSFIMPSYNVMVQRMQAMVDEVNAAIGTSSSDCRSCGAKNTEPVLINGIVDRICRACIEKMQEQAHNLAAAYDAIPVRWVRALATAAILGLIGAIVWDTVIIYTHTMFWLLAIGIGVVIGWATTKAAGKGHVSVQVISGLFTVLAVVGGMTVLYALAAADQSMQNNAINTSMFTQIFFDSLKGSIENIAFATGGGLIGAAVAAQRAGRPSFKVSVEG